jgi:hypothetical protein
MSQNVPKNSTSTVNRERAAAMVADDVMTDDDIASELSINRRTLTRWKGEAKFKARVAAIVDETRKALVARGIIEKQNRLDALNDRWSRMKSVIEQRSQIHSDYAGGGDTGLIVKQTKGIGKGEDFQVIEEYAVDTGLLKELREHEKQAAQELGEWAERHEHSNPDGSALMQPLANVIEKVYGDDANSNS